MRTAAKILIVVVALASTGWSGLFIYWHLKIRSAIHQLAAEAELPEPAKSESDLFRRRPESYRFLQEAAGCRALPYLVGALDPKTNPRFLEAVTFLFYFEVEGKAMQSVGSPLRQPERLQWHIQLEDSIDVRARKCEIIREFWRQNGHRHHQVWRIWSRECVSKD